VVEKGSNAGWPSVGGDAAAGDATPIPGCAYVFDGYVGTFDCGNCTFTCPQQGAEMNGPARASRHNSRFF